MSTRLRVILKYPSGEQIRGPIAVTTICHLINPKSYRGLTRNMLGYKRAKLEELGRQLPKGYALILVQEPRNTRRSRSFCWNRIDPPQPVPQMRLMPPQVDLLQQQPGAIHGNEVFFAPEPQVPVPPPPEPNRDAQIRAALQAAHQDWMQRQQQAVRWAPVAPAPRPRRRNP